MARVPLDGLADYHYTLPAALAVRFKHTIEWRLDWIRVCVARARCAGRRVGASSSVVVGG